MIHRKREIIFKDIQLIRRRLQSIEKIDACSAGSWQQAWDKHPDLRAWENSLFAEYGRAR